MAREQLQVEVLLPDFVGRSLERPIGMRAGVVEQHIDPAELLFGGGEDAGAVFRLADIGSDADNLAFALAGQRLTRLLQHVGTARDDRYARPRAHEVRGSGKADAFTAAGDQRAAAVHSHVDHQLIPSE